MDQWFGEGSMEITDPLNIYDQLDRNNTDESVAHNLNVLREANAKIAQKKSFYPTRESEIAIFSLSAKLDFKRTYAFLGAMLGIFPPASFFILFIAESNPTAIEIWVIALLIGVNTITGFVGYFFGKVVGSLLHDRNNRSLTFYIFFLPFLGLLWGAIAGAAGGVFLFVIGAFFGAIIGGTVGMLALPAFYAMHRLLKQGEYLELKYFLPVATGIVYSIFAFILGYIGRS